MRKCYNSMNKFTKKKSWLITTGIFYNIRICFCFWESQNDLKMVNLHLE